MGEKLPVGWEWKKLNDLAQFIYGYPFDSSKFNNEGQGTPLIRIRNLIKDKTDTFFDGEFEESYLVQNGDILIGMDGEFNIVRWGGEEALLNQRICKLESTSATLIPSYAFRVLKKILKRIEDKTPHVTVKHLSAKQLNSIQIPFPPLETQRKIVAILEKADETKRLRVQADELTNQLLQSVFLEMFGDPVTNPMGWEMVKLGKLCKIRRGASPRPIKDYLGGGVPWVKIGDGTKGDDIYITETKERIINDGVSKSVLLKAGSLIFANCGVSLGFARILKVNGCIHDGWLSLEDINPKLTKIYLLKLINSISDYFRKTAPAGTQPNLNTTIMKNFGIPLPPIELQNKFAAIVKQVGQSKEQQKQSKEQLNNLFNALMQKAFKGELTT